MNEQYWRLECVSETVGKALIAAGNDPLSEALGRQLLETVAEIRAQRKLQPAVLVHPPTSGSNHPIGSGPPYSEVSRCIMATLDQHGALTTQHLLERMGLRHEYGSDDSYRTAVRHCVRQLKKAGRVLAEQKRVGESHVISLPQPVINGAISSSIEPVDWESMQ